MSAHSGCLLGVDGCDLAGLADGLFDHWILAIAGRKVSVDFRDSPSPKVLLDIHVLEWHISLAEGRRGDEIHIHSGAFAHINIELLNFLHYLCVSR